MIGWREFALRDALQAALGIPVLVDNDVNTLAIAERLYGRGRDAEHFIALTLGRGVGLGIVANGDIYHGYGGGAGEFGHVTAVAGGPVCSCGKRGCLEAVVSDPALVATARERGIIGTRQGVAALRRKADVGDEAARSVYADAAAVLGQSVADLVNVLSPKLILVSGEGTQAWAHFEDAFEKSLRAHVFPPLRGVTVEVDPWDDAKWAVGAASLVLRADIHPACRRHAKRACDASLGSSRLACNGGGRLTTRSCWFPRALPPDLARHPGKHSQEVIRKDAC